MNWALIGASTIASQHMIGAFRAQAAGDVSWVISGSASRGAEYAREHSIPHSSVEIADALSDPDVNAVYISSTNDKHFDQAMAAISAGKHVLCEKPLAMSVADARAMVIAAEKAGVVFATNHHLRCSGSHNVVRDLITSGRIGTMLSARIFQCRCGRCRPVCWSAVTKVSRTPLQVPVWRYTARKGQSLLPA